MTSSSAAVSAAFIIPYQELLGNYDVRLGQTSFPAIIPYQELLGNYDRFSKMLRASFIIPYQELLGNYDCVWAVSALIFLQLQCSGAENCPSPSVLMVKAVPPSTTTDRASGIRIMGARRTRPPMCITAGFSRRAAVLLYDAARLGSHIHADQVPEISGRGYCHRRH